MASVYINRIASFLPNAPVSNDEIEDFIGKIGGDPSRVRSIVLRQNGILNRYYALISGNIYTYLNIVGKNNLFSVKLSERHLFVDGVYKNEQNSYHYPQQIMELSTIGNPERSKSLNGTIQLDYNHILDSKNSFIWVLEM